MDHCCAVLAMTVLLSLLITPSMAGTLSQIRDIEVSSGDIPRPDPAWQRTNVITGDEDDLVAMVTELQHQMKEQRLTYARQRSALHLLQEKVDRQETEFSKIKAAVVLLQSQQGERTAELAKLKKETEDQKWAVRDLKDAQNRFHDDVLIIKREQKITNGSLETFMDLIEETYEGQQTRVDNFERRLNRMEDRLQHVTDVVHEGKLNFTGLELAVNNFKKELNITNQVRLVDAGNTEGSGDREEWDKIASTVEENSNTIGHAMNHISKTEQMVTTRVSNIHHQVSSQSSKMDILNFTLQNMSSTVSAVQDLLHDAKTGWTQAFKSVEDNIINLSDQLLDVSKWRKTVDVDIKDNERAMLENKYKIEKTRESTIPFGGRIRYIQKLLADIQHQVQEKQRTMTVHVKSIQNNVSLTSDRLKTHVSRASSALKSAVYKLDKLTPKVSSIDNRLAHVEVKVLNASLQECQRSHSKATHELRVRNLELELRFLKQSSESHDRHIRKLVSDIMEISSYAHTNDVAIKKLSQMSENISSLIPSFEHSQQEVDRFATFLPQDCTQIFRQGNPMTGLYLIRPMGSTLSLPVKCDVPNRQQSWTVIQRRVKGDVSFARPWYDYREGFGDLDGDYWIGNENLYHMTHQGNYSLRIEMWDMKNELWVAEYQHFRVGDEANNYKLSVSGYTGNATDSLSYSNNMAFSTQEMDNDASSTHCARFYTSGWWYKHCHYGNLNGRAFIGIVWFNHNKDDWMQLHRTVMKISRRD